MAGGGSSDLEQPLIRAVAGGGDDHDSHERRAAGGHAGSCTRCSVWQTTSALLTLQLGWGLWLLPCDFARLGWVGGFASLATLAALTGYSGSLFTRLFQAVPSAVLFGDIGAQAAGKVGRLLVYITIYSLDATRCIILHLAATQSLYHAVAPSLPAGQELPLWQCSVVVAMLILLLGQIRYLTQLSGFFMTGTAAQLVALVIVVYDLILHPGPDADRGDSVPSPFLVKGSSMHEGEVQMMAPAIMAVLNMIFAYGGQFAYLEIMTSMAAPSRFTTSVNACTAIMTALYGGLGAVGYWSKGSSMSGIVIFNMRPGKPAQVAAALILLQALAQYLVNLNIWTHNLLVLLGRASDRAQASHARCDGSHSAATSAQGNAAHEQHVDAVVGDNGQWPLPDGAPATTMPSAPPTSAEHMTTGDHSSAAWLGATTFVAAYSGAIAVLVPFFCTLVGLVTSVTYLTCAYTLPSWFMLRLAKQRGSGLALHPGEKWLLTMIIPLSVIASAVGLAASLRTFVYEAGGGEGM